jgi:hypothetical protein
MQQRTQHRPNGGWANGTAACAGAAGCECAHAREPRHPIGKEVSPAGDARSLRAPAPTPCILVCVADSMPNAGWGTLAPTGPTPTAGSELHTPASTRCACTSSCCTHVPLWVALVVLCSQSSCRFAQCPAPTSFVFLARLLFQDAGVVGLYPRAVALGDGSILVSDVTFDGSGAGIGAIFASGPQVR